jgi:hypothetical protein
MDMNLFNKQRQGLQLAHKIAPLDWSMIHRTPQKQRLNVKCQA